MSWRSVYLLALQERDRYEKADLDLYHAYTRLADRTAVAEAATVDRAEGATVEEKTEPATRLKSARGTPTSATEKRGTPSMEGGLAQLKQDLAEAQRARVSLQVRLRHCTDELEQLRSQTTVDTTRIRDLTTERNVLAVKVKDRDAELRGKAKLLEDIQDEMMALNLQLNMAESRSAELVTENKDLVARLMAWKGQEADAVNHASKFS
ncbi:MAG: hypothetical protein M1838_006151 [Thelocarpon superellum]|nr:MAG: hypothetical protein M1838_006151 [Thelocarpon superellum]